MSSILSSVTEPIRPKCFCMARMDARNDRVSAKSADIDAWNAKKHPSYYSARTASEISAHAAVCAERLVGKFDLETIKSTVFAVISATLYASWFAKDVATVAIVKSKGFGIPYELHMNSFKYAAEAEEVDVAWKAYYVAKEAFTGESVETDSFIAAMTTMESSWITTKNSITTVIAESKTTSSYELVCREIIRETWKAFYANEPAAEVAFEEDWRAKKVEYDIALRAYNAPAKEKAAKAAAKAVHTAKKASKIDKKAAKKAAYKAAKASIYAAKVAEAIKKVIKSAIFAKAASCSNSETECIIRYNEFLLEEEAAKVAKAAKTAKDFIVAKSNAHYNAGYRNARLQGICEKDAQWLAESARDAILSNPTAFSDVPSGPVY